MKTVQYLLVGDGPSDAVLGVIIDWALLERGVIGNGEFADARRYPGPIADRIRAALQDVIPALDILFLHRDAEKEPLDVRREEIVRGADANQLQMPYVRVIPVRMTEAWLLSSEAALRSAAGNPNGIRALSLPRIKDLETLPDPKRMLSSLLLDAASHRPRLRKKLDLSEAVHRVPIYTDTFAPLRRLKAFQAFEADLDSALLKLS